MNWARNMNWTRGLIRLWVLTSLVWVIVNFGEAGSMAARAQSNCESARYDALTPPPPDPSQSAPAQKSKFDRLENKYGAFFREQAEEKRRWFFSMTPDERIAGAEQTCRLEHQSAAKEVATRMLALPVALFIVPVAIFFIGAWVVRGFRREGPQV